jgi:hypothetical protein
MKILIISKLIKKYMEFESYRFPGRNVVRAEQMQVRISGVFLVADISVWIVTAIIIGCMENPQ